MNLINEMIIKILETPEVISQIKRSLVNRDLVIEIDGKRFQIIKKQSDSNDSPEAEIRDLKARLYDLVCSLKELLRVVKKNENGLNLNKAIERATITLDNQK